MGSLASTIEDSLNYGPEDIFARVAASNGPNLFSNGTSNSNTSPLFFSAKYNHCFSLNIIIHNGGKLNMVDKKQNTLLHVAVKNGSLEFAKLLLSKRNIVPINKRNKKGNAAMHIAIKNDNVDMLNLLLDNNADVSVKNGSGEDILQAVIGNAAFKCAEVLVERDIQLPKSSNMCCIEIYKLLMEYIKQNNGAERDTTSEEKLVLFILMRKIDKHGSNIIDFQKFYALCLHFASARGNCIVVKLLLEKHPILYDMPQNANGYLAIHTAASLGQSEVISTIMETLNNVDINVKAMHANVLGGSTALHVAFEFLSTHKRILIIETLVKRGADCNFLNVVGNTPVHLCIQKYNTCCFTHNSICKYLPRLDECNEINEIHSNIIKDREVESKCVLLAVIIYLVENGNANIDIENVFGERAIDYVGNEAEIEYLVRKRYRSKMKQRASIDPPKVIENCLPFDVQDNISIHYACSINSEELLKTLLFDAMDTINDIDENGKTALHVAVECSSTICVKILLENGIKVNKKDRHNESELAKAILAYDANNEEKRNCQKDIINMLLKNVQGGIEDECFLAILLKKVDVVKMFMETHIEAFHFNLRKKNNSFFHAASCASNDVLKLFLHKIPNFNLNQQNDESKTALHITVAERNFYTMQWLICSGAECNIGDFSRRTALHIVSSFGLCQYEGSQCCSDYKVNRCEHILEIYTSSKKFSKCVLLAVMLFMILKGNADINAKDDSGKSPLDYIKKKVIIQHLQRYYAIARNK